MKQIKFMARKPAVLPRDLWLPRGEDRDEWKGPIQHVAGAVL